MGHSTPRLKRLLRPACLAALLLVATACDTGADPQGVFEDYRLAVAASLDLDPATLPAYPGFAPQYPGRAERQAPVSRTNVGLRQFWAFGECDLRAAIAERNTPLGRSTSAVVQLPYQHALLVALQDCAAGVGDDAEPSSFTRLLNDITAIKVAERSASYWNATFGSSEFAAMFSPSARPLPLNPDEIVAPAKALGFFVDNLDAFGTPRGNFSGAELPAAYQQLEQSAFGGRLLKSLHTANFYLAEVTRLLVEHADTQQLCPMDAPTRRARELDRALRRYHLRVLQPYLATLGQRSRSWLEDLDRLATAQREVMPDAFAPFYDRYLNGDQPDAIWPRHLQVLRSHARAWSQLLGDCGIAL